MKRLRELISNDEYEMLSTWRDWYALDYADTNDLIDIKSLLAVWEEENQTLYELLGNKLITSKEFNYNKSEDQLAETMNEGINGWTEFGRKKHSGHIFYNAYIDWVNKYYPSVVMPDSIFESQKAINEWEKENEQNRLTRTNLYYLINPRTLVKNKYEGNTFSITLPNNKKFVINNGSKPLKTLAKIASVYTLDGFEEFRLTHSLVLNDKSTKGVINLSIHPLDYWTMSDNDSGWDSCMSWSDNGCYKQGTIEMMNSPMVVVAYLSSSDPMHINNNLFWNNKKWRMLFIVNEGIIMGIKSYPYNNTEITNTILNWIKQLAKENLGWTYDQSEPYKWVAKNDLWNKSEGTPKEKSEYLLRLYTNNMYNDVGCCNGHMMYYNFDKLFFKDCTYTSLYEYSNVNIKNIEYSGYAQCMVCGETNDNFSGEDLLTCDDCSDIPRCEHCGERIYYGDEVYYVEEKTICYSCWENSVINCPICEENILDNNIKYIKFVFKKTEQEINDYYNKNNQNTSDSPKDGYSKMILFDSVGFCENCQQEFIKKYLKEDADVGVYDIIHSDRGLRQKGYIVYMEDITEEGWEILSATDEFYGITECPMLDNAMFEIICTKKIA